jgi:hypothetical protein
MYRPTFVLAGCFSVLFASLDASAQTLITRYNFNGDLLNASTFVDANLVTAPHGTFREGATVAGSVAGTATFGTGVDGVSNGALVLDGVDDWVDLTTAGHPGQQIAGTFSSGPGIVSGTVMAWVRFDQTLEATPRWLIGNVNAADTQSYRFGWNGARLESNASGSNSATNKFTVSDSTASSIWADGQWHHVAAAWNGVGSSGRIYVDGLPVGTAPGASTLSTATPQAAWQFPMSVGARDNGGVLDGFWSGLVDDLRVYRERLSNTQVLAIFNATTVVPDPVDNADFDDDGVVDGSDFLAWQRGLGVGTTLAEGDANDDGAVDAADLAVWTAQFGDGTAPIAAVPEPGAGLLFAVAMGALVLKRRGAST